MTMNLYSPDQNPLVVLEGSHSDIWKRGEYLRTLGVTMTTTAASLKTISEGTSQISEAVDKLRESAGEVHSDLDKAGTRYEKTGGVLRTYATALDAAHAWLNPLVEDIEEKHNEVQTARNEQRDAQRTVNDADTTWLWETEATDAEKTAASTALSEAGTALTTAEGQLDTLWTSYDLHFGIWSEAYDAAVQGIEGAIDAADNNDNWFDDALDIFIEVLGWVAVALVVAALFVAAPLAAVLLAIAAVITVVSLLAHIYLAFKGRATATDIILDVVGIIPFVKPVAAVLRAGGGFGRVGSGLFGIFKSPAASSAVGIARSKLTHFMLHGVRGQAAQTAARESVEALLKPGVNRFGTAWSRIIGGDAATAELIVLNNHIRNTVLPAVPKMDSWLRNPVVQGAMPSINTMRTNVGSFVLGFDQVAQQVIPPYGEFREAY
jgi:hypothetical protein